MNIWKTMSQIDTRNLVEKKNGFTYLSWSHALKLLKDHVPDAMVTKDPGQRPDRRNRSHAGAEPCQQAHSKPKQL